MKINIITQPLFCNYGGILQNYALQEILRRMGHEVLTINVPPKAISVRASWKAYVHCCLNFIGRLRNEYDCPFLNPHTFAVKERELSFPQREFVKRHIEKVDCNVPFPSDLNQQYPADAWIVGSDQVWRPWCSPNIGNYFFDFLDGDITRIAYAASFGTDRWEIDPEITPEIRKLANKFRAISVREESGVGLCKEYLDVDAKHVLDPTMLLSADDYQALTSEKDYPSGDYIATYVLDADAQKKRWIEGVVNRLGMREEKVGRMHRERFDSIESWMATIAHSKRVITDSFHGTVFSIIFNRPVKILGNTLRGNARLDSLLKMLELECDSDGFYRIDKVTESRYAELRKKSIDFLQESLS